MSNVLENWQDIRELVLMSIGTDKGSWWADEKFGSELWILRQKGKVDGQTAGTVRRMITECLKWLIDDGLATKIDVAAEREGKNRISYQVTVHKPNGETELIQEVWNGIQA